MFRSVRMMRRGYAAASAGLVLVLGGCDDVANAFRGKTITMSGAGVVMDKPFEPYDEASLKDLIASSAGQPLPPAGDSLARTMGGFSNDLYASRAGEDAATRQNRMRDARNGIQGALLTTSGNRCNAFKLLLRERSTNTNFILGSLATGLGAAGAIVTGGASQALAGAASAASGVGAEYNKDIMASITSSVIIPGIDKQRSNILQEITNRRCLGLSSYGLTEAMADAVRYHAACSTDVGVAAASSALSQTNHGDLGGLASAKSTADAVVALRAALNPKASSGSPAGGGAVAGAAKAPGTSAADAGDASEKVASQPPKATTLVGEPITYTECPSLMANGTSSVSAKFSKIPSAKED